MLAVPPALFSECAMNASLYEKAGGWAAGFFVRR
jgi:hypothetical protein